MTQARKVWLDVILQDAHETTIFPGRIVGKPTDVEMGFVDDFHIDVVSEDNTVTFGGIIFDYDPDVLQEHLKNATTEYETATVELSIVQEEGAEKDVVFKNQAFELSQNATVVLTDTDGLDWTLLFLGHETIHAS